MPMIDLRPCKDCEDYYGDALYDGSHHWHCAACGEIAGHQGHYMLLAAGWGFSCQVEGE
jgi:hypothetical protein